MVGALFVGGLASCGETAPLRWQFDFASEALRARTTGVAAEVRRGSCQGVTVFSTWISRDGAASAPGTLDPGTYGFVGRARDANCNFFAEGCTEVQIPTGAPIRVLLAETGSLIPDPTCATNTDIDPVGGDGASSDGAAGDGSDAQDGAQGDGADDPGFDAGEPDAGSPPVAPPDAGEPLVDAGAPVVTSQCEGLDTAVVACFDFNGDLRDASGQNNDASGDAQFEPSPLGQALRPGGAAIKVADDPSLALTEFTVELWFRPDGLTNLAGNVNDTSLIVDRDQTFTFGYEASGDPIGQVYVAQDSNRTLTGDLATLTVGEWVYFAFTYDGNSARMFRNGESVAQRTLGIDVFTGVHEAMHIGTGSPAATRPFDGLIDALRISNVARSASEICEAAGKTFDRGNCD